MNNIPEQHTSQPRLGDYFIADVLDHAPTPQAAARIEDAYTRHGTAFAVYLGLEDIDRYSTTVEAEFTNCYIGYYPTQDALIDDTIDTFGWQESLDEFLNQHIDLKPFLSLDRDGIWDFIQDSFEVVDLGGLHVFEK